MNFDVMVDVSLSGAVHGYGLRQFATWRSESRSYVAFASEPSDGKTRQFKPCVPIDSPVFAVEVFTVG